uniref:Integrase zinc-binding domain-containing protein n=1 Tax=Amphimedon queenslandica TaxID=400682 RepID=A0A1X7VPE6_AMPQE
LLIVVWFPGQIDDLEGVVKTCRECQHHKEDPETPLHPLEQPTRPWQRIHLDFAGLFKGQMCLILVDAYSK